MNPWPELSMKHYVSYHNAEKMGYSFEDSDPFFIGTKKTVNRLVGGKIWSIAGVGKPRNYFLGSWFIVDEAGQSEQAQFKNYARGSNGRAFEPLIPLSGLVWFPAFLKSQNHFSLGLQPIKEEFVAHFEAFTGGRLTDLPRATLYTDEIESAVELLEGAVCRIFVNAYERNPKARRHCIACHGTICFICGFDFGQAYGAVADGFIHVHHLRELSQLRGEYKVDPENDLRPVCPNCHAVLHRKKPAYTIEEVQGFLKKPN